MANALAHEKSPYLLQHAENPVDWQPWGEGAFARARAEQKPIFLSIGYSTCHWCHVMAHESFEDAEIAGVLNTHFVPVKVDREERPDVDKIYMTYVQAVTGHGGWPLSAWLTPELKPFFGGTYFPREDRAGRPGFASVLRAIAHGWQHDREKLVAESERVIDALRTRLSEDQTGAAAERELADAASDAFEKGFQYFHENFDGARGGFGGAPKFPRAGNVMFLLRCAALQGRESEVGRAAIDMAATTLGAMARGGIHDHVGGGFHRYAVDEDWQVPHFEKMLYDQAQIALNALETWQATGDERHAWLARDIFDYVRRELASREGAFYSAEDADSLREAGGTEHAEGAFYVWTAEELRRALGEDYALVAAHFGVEEKGNVPAARDPQGEFAGRNILAQQRSLARTATQLGLPLQAASDRLAAALERLRAVRAARPRPQRDDKVIAAWNGLMIAALARAAVTPAESLRDQRAFYRAAAVRAAEFLRRELWDEAQGVLYRSWRGARGAAAGFAEDYAAVIQAALDLYAATFEVRWLEWAERLQTRMDELFWDEAGGGYFNSAAGAADLVLRLKEDYDGAEPAPASVAAMNLLRLAGLLEREDWRARGRATIEALRGQWSKAPHALPQLLCALELALEPPRHVVLAGEPGAADFEALADVVHGQLRAQRLVAGVTTATREWWGRRAPWMAEMKPIEGRATAYVCEAFACQAPVRTAVDLGNLLAR
ncbi:thioredoxin domain-containing protein [Horticoccus luteus]|uniref:Thioredoxin domain-containing protein n=1 Tax=Horticoccus luteus TaxID=2862869 RepID=A0A8F9TTV7_9BACT|nr:thioredoxin domain-containing protein [Horticoccus luteus]QYM78193.1 thioredoxin domain-containing protein [Horticoccus luteus]